MADGLWTKDDTVQMLRSQAFGLACLCQCEDRDCEFEQHKVAKVGVGLTAHGRRSKSGKTPDRAADL
ncbi:hypothetical protein ABIB94_006703 [Bradyrhizobium sp. JR7.2]